MKYNMILSLFLGFLINCTSQDSAQKSDQYAHSHFKSYIVGVDPAFDPKQFDLNFAEVFVTASVLIKRTDRISYVLEIKASTDSLIETYLTYLRQNPYVKYIERNGIVKID